MVEIPGMKQVSEVVWEIPTSYKQGMVVPARIYATKKLLGEMDRGVFEQVTNVASLPGIVKHAYAMADAHWGYGFPIGGVAAFDMEKGVISPGGIGFDVNCLHPDSKIYDADGTWRRISSIDIKRDGFLTVDHESRTMRETGALVLMKRKESQAIYRITTSCGNEIKVTGDHPLLTQRGMVLARDLTPDDALVSSGFEGMERTDPALGDLEILSPELLRNAMQRMGITQRGSAQSQILTHLAKLGLDRCTLRHRKLPILLKLLGLVFGDGTIPKTKPGNGAYTTFFGKREDLEQVKNDLQELGFRSSLHQRKRHHRIQTKYRISEFDFIEDSLMVSSSSLSVLLVALGAPHGRKASSEYSLPGWIHKAEDWQKRLFLAAYFGAELDKPRTVNGYNFWTLSFSVNKLESLRANAIAFLDEVKSLLASLGVETSQPVVVDGYSYNGKYGNSVGFRLSIQPNAENLKCFFGKIGYIYNQRKQRLASLASLYISLLMSVRKERDEVRARAIEMHSNGLSASTIVASLATERAGASFVRHSIWAPRGEARVWGEEKFAQFCDKEYGASGLLFDDVKTIEELPYEGEVYDVTIDDPNHNFIASSLVVSNCGMRLIRTNLRFADVKPKVKELVDLLFRLVPAGVGVKGFVNVSQSQFEEIMKFGVKWCAENDYGWDDDVSHVEEGGFIKGADPSKVSGQASSRGIRQLGTLGSGNHYLEIQVVDPSRHFDPELAKNFGIVHPDQVLVMIHCGSRGFGHQVGSDYLRIFDGAMKRYGINVRDRELACAPFSSKEGGDYYGAMVCAANMAFANRQVVVQRVREAFKKVFHREAEALDLHIIYDVCHNIAKVEKHRLDGSEKELLVHRKGATRSFGPGHHDIPAPYRQLGQPVIIGGSMETGSYLLLGTARAMEETFGSTAHGSGRTMSRTAAKKQFRGSELQRSMESRGIYVKAATMDGLAEEAGVAYKDISEVVETMSIAGISKKVVALRPIGNIKG